MSSRILRNLSLFVLLATACVCALPQVAQAGDWTKHEADMAAFDAKMTALQKEIGELVEKRKGTESADDAKKINEEISTKYAELKKTHDEYDAEKLHMRFQHPEKGDLAERQYTRGKLEALKDLENDLSLDGQLDRMRAKLTAVYGLEPIHKGAEPKYEGDRRAPASTSASEEEIQRITLKK